MTPSPVHEKPTKTGFLKKTPWRAAHAILAFAPAKPHRSHFKVLSEQGRVESQDPTICNLCSSSLHENSNSSRQLAHFSQPTSPPPPAPGQLVFPNASWHSCASPLPIIGIAPNPHAHIRLPHF